MPAWATDYHEACPYYTTAVGSLTRAQMTWRTSGPTVPYFPVITGSTTLVPRPVSAPGTIKLAEPLRATRAAALNPGSVAGSFTRVRRRPPDAHPHRPRTLATSSERRPAVLESVLGATPQEFESPILRRADLTLWGPGREAGPPFPGQPGRAMLPVTFELGKEAGNVCLRRNRRAPQAL